MKDDIITGMNRGPIINPLKYPSVKCDKCDGELFEEKLLSEDVTGVIDLKRAGDGWPGEYFNSPKVLKNLINTIFILYK